MSGSLEIMPTPSDEEAAAIAAALRMAWPQAAGPVELEDVPTSWRFSGRWWRTPTWRRPIQRRRP